MAPATGLLARMALTGGVLSGFYVLLVWTLRAAGFELPVVVGGVAAFVGIQSLFGRTIPLWALDAQPLPRDDFAAFHAEVDRVADRQGLDEPPTILVVEVGVANAFPVGRRGNGTVVVSKQLLGALQFDEAVAVVTHELAHLDNRNTVLMIIGVSVAWGVDLVIAILASEDDDPAVGVVGTILGTVAHVVVMLFVFALSRSREHAADAAAARTLGRADPLVRALRRIEETNEQLREFARHSPRSVRSVSSRNSRGWRNDCWRRALPSSVVSNASGRSTSERWYAHVGCCGTEPLGCARRSPA